MALVDWFIETIGESAGKPVRRVRTPVILFAGFACVASGIYMMVNGGDGFFFLLFTLAPCLFLYPLIRVFFGGRDSVAGVITTIVVEEYLKSTIKSSNRKKHRKRN